MTKSGPSDFQFFLPTQVLFGHGKIGEVERFVAPGVRPVIITGQRSARASGALDAILEQLPHAAVFDHVEENPTTLNCDEAADFCRANEIDVIVALGGGSAMDVAKAAAGLARNPGSCADYFGRETFKDGALPVIAVPTTSGTGSEVTQYAVIVDTDTRTKRTIGGRNLFPRVAVLDPDLTVSMPRGLTINTGLDALSQAMEGMVSVSRSPLGDILGLRACRLIRQYLPRAANDGSDIEARAQMLYAAMLSGVVIAQSGTTLVHGMGYYYTLECGIAHGLANALLLTPLFQHNAEHLPNTVAALATTLGIPTKANASDARANIKAALHTFLKELGIGPAARGSGVDHERLPLFAAEVASDPYRYRNQVGEITEEKILGFYQQSYAGN